MKPIFPGCYLSLFDVRPCLLRQDYIAAVYDLSVAYPDVPVFQTAADVVGAGTATARSQYYGSANNRSLWLGGMFDYRGLSDYTPIEEQVLRFALSWRELPQGWHARNHTTQAFVRNVCKVLRGRQS